MLSHHTKQKSISLPVSPDEIIDNPSPCDSIKTDSTSCLPSPLHLERQNGYEIDKDHECYHNHADLVQITRLERCYCSNPNGKLVKYHYRCGKNHEGECVKTVVLCPLCESRYDNSAYLNNNKK